MIDDKDLIVETFKEHYNRKHNEKRNIALILWGLFYATLVFMFLK